MTESLFLNTLAFRYPSEGVTCYFSAISDAQEKSEMMKHKSVFPKEIKDFIKDSEQGDSGNIYFSPFPKEGFKPIVIDFNDEANENFVKRYYNYRLKIHLAQYNNLIFTQSGITRDLQVWVQSEQPPIKVKFKGKDVKVWQIDRFTLKIRFDTFNHRPYLLIASDRPASMLNVTLSQLTSDDPFNPNSPLDIDMVHKVMIRVEKDGHIIRRILELSRMHELNITYDRSTTRPILTGQMKHLLGIDNSEESYTIRESKYVKYLRKITDFKEKYLNSDELRQIFPELATEFTKINELQVDIADAHKRLLTFGNGMKNVRPQIGINNGPAVMCPYKEVKLITIFHENDSNEAGNISRYLMMGNYGQSKWSKQLSSYIGANVDHAGEDFQIIFSDPHNPVPEVKAALQRDCYINRNMDVKYVGIYLSPINKYADDRESRKCYYKVKEAFLKLGIPTQCIDVVKMRETIDKDSRSQYKNFVYTLQNMSVAICAKLGGAPWLLDEAEQRELIIGIGAFKSEQNQYLGAAFLFDNKGVFNKYNYFQKSELRELVGAIKDAIISYTSVNDKPSRLIIHYYKKLSLRYEFVLIEKMLNSLEFDIPVYVITINKTESEDVVLFDAESRYSIKNVSYDSLMPISGRYVNLGHVREGQRFLLCSNTRYDDYNFKPTDGFPFPVKLTIICPNRQGDIDGNVVRQLIEQVYQFSRIYWKSVKQQGLPVTIKYPEMMAEIMPHFDDPTAYCDNRSLWFL